MTARLRTRGFTMVEMAIGAIIFGLLMVSLLAVYRYSIESYRITTWKQERLQQAELFWNFMRKNLEEASDKIDIAGDLTVDPRPLLYRSVIGTGANGPILRWMRSRMGPSGIPDYRIESQVLFRDGKVLVQSAPTPGNVAPPDELVPTPKEMLSDVRVFSITTTPIRLDPVRGQYLDSGGGAHPIVGSLAEISIRFGPPPDSGMPTALEVTQNHKFKLAVHSQNLAGPAAFPPFP